MNHREPPHPSAAVRKALYCLALCLLPVAAPVGAHAFPSLDPLIAVIRVAGSTPYLPVVGAPPLRFQEPAVAAIPATPAPLFSNLPADRSSVESITVPDTEPAPTDPTRSAETPADVAKSTEVQSAQPAKTPAPILPDEVRPTVRPEDFLPYFQVPGSARDRADVTLLVPAPNAPPAPGNLPASSATYTQTPK